MPIDIEPAGPVVVSYYTKRASQGPIDTITHVRHIKEQGHLRIQETVFQSYNAQGKTVTHAQQGAHVDIIV